MDIVKGANLGLAFVIEVLMLAAFGYWGFQLPLGFPLPWLAAAVAVAVGIAVWAIWGAPRSTRRLAMPALIVFKVVMFGAAALALWAADLPLLAAWFAVISVIHLVLATMWKQV